MKKEILGPILAMLLFGLFHLDGGQAAGPPSIAVIGAVKHALTLTKQDLSVLPRSKANLDEHGKPVGYEGVLLSEVLKKAGAPVGEELRGRALATYVLAKGRDGYQVVYSLAELDPLLTEAKVLLADKMEGKPLSGSTGPFRLVAPADKKMAR